MGRFLFVFLIMVFAFLVWSSMPAAAHPRYSHQTGLSCIACHKSVSGGGELNPLGENFRASAYQWPLPQGEVKGPFLSLPEEVRIGLRWLHFLALVAWLGTIAVVHLVIGPQVAARGIPRIYLRVAWPAMATILASGALMTLGRLTSWNDLLDSRWGTALVIKVTLFFAMVAFAVFETKFLSPRLRRLGQPSDGAPENGEKLARGDGKEGRPVYVSREGILHDLSSSPAWKGGLHMGRHHAGRDLTEALRDAPHGPEMLARFPVVAPRAESPQYLRWLRLHRTLAWGVVVLALGVLLASAFMG